MHGIRLPEPHVSFELVFLCGRGRHLTPSLRDGVRCLPAIQKLFGSFKGDAFSRECCPFFMREMTRVLLF